MSLRLPLDGIRVADFCWAVAGPTTTKVLALYGAEVIKVESRARLDGARAGNPFLDGRPGVNRSGYFSDTNPSKLSIRLDMEKPEAREIARRLVAAADIVSESFSAGVMGRWGLDYDELAKVKPDLIMISLTMQGQTGPYAGHVGIGRTLAGVMGLDHLTGWPEGPPAGPNQPYTDLVVPWFAVTALLAALRHRKLTGRGQYIDLSQLEASLHFLAPAVLEYTANGRVQARNGNRVSHAAPHGVYPCRGDAPLGRWCAIAAFNDTQWRSLCRVMGQPGLEHDPRFGTLLARKRNEAELDRVIASWTSDQEAEDVAERLKAAGLPAAIVATGRDLHQDPQLRHRGHLVLLEHPVMGQRTHRMPSFRMSGVAPNLRRSPLLGEHSDYVYREVLGMAEGEVARLQEQGVLS